MELLSAKHPLSLRSHNSYALLTTFAAWCGCPYTSRRVPASAQLIPPSLGLACIRKDVLVQLDHTPPREIQLTRIKEFICQDIFSWFSEQTSYYSKRMLLLYNVPLRLFSKIKKLKKDHTSVEKQSEGQHLRKAFFFLEGNIYHPDHSSLPWKKSWVDTVMKQFWREVTKRW